MTSILNNIAAEVETRLKNITTANGYDFDVSDVSFMKRNTDDFNNDPKSILIEQDDETISDDHSYPGNPPAVAYEVKFQIWGFASSLDHTPSGPGTEDAGVSDNAMMAAIRKSLTTVSSGQWHTFGGNAINSEIIAASPFDGPGSNGGMVELQVLYRTSELDPAVARN